MRSFITIAAVIAAFSGHPAFAEDPPGQQPVRIEIDQKTKTFVFIIDDKPVALLDETGLHVREGVHYGASLTDEGQSGFDKRIEELKEEARHD